MSTKCPKCRTPNPADSKFCKECGAALAPPPLTQTIQTPEGTPAKTIAGKYRLLEELGRGGMGVVYRAKDMRLKRTVALKFLAAELTRDKQAKARFIQEAQAAAALDHSNICTVYEVDEAAGQTYIAMAYIEGQSLKDKLKDGPLDIEKAKEIVLQVAEGLKEAHEKGIIHRDIKPANIMLTKKGQAKITDFGLAKLSWGVDLTKASTILGTVAYMSPEQARGEEVDQRTDIWSLGAMLYEMLTGERPFKKDREHALIHEILNEDPPAIKILRPDIPGSFEQVIKKSMEKNAADRYANAQQFIAGLQDRPAVSLSEFTNSIAVLPFVNMSSDPEQEYFCDGISEEIINALTHIGKLRVIARTSAFAFKGKNEDAREIGKKLDVETLLEGSVRKGGNRLRITAQLIRVTDGSHLWSERFDREMKDIFEVQDEISSAIVNNLEIKLLGSEKKAMLKHHTENSELYNVYLLARFYTNKRNTESLNKAIGYYKKAIRMDPDYALLYVGLSEAYALSAIGYSAAPPKDAFAKAKEAALAAIKIDDELAEAHTALAYLKEFYESDLPGAEREFKRAIELNPGYAPAHQYYSEFLCCRKRWDEAHREINLAIQLDPLSFVIRNHLGWLYHYQDKIDPAIEQYLNVIEMAPDYAVAYFNLGTAYTIKGQYEKALEFAKKAVKLSGGSPMWKAGLAFALARAGKTSQALKIRDELIELAAAGQKINSSLAVVYIGLNQQDEALKTIETAFKNKEPVRAYPRAWVENYLASDLFNKDQRFTRLLKKYGLE